MENNFIASNDMFRPNDLITNSESLKLIMQAKGIPRDENDDWKAGYASKAMSEGIILAEYNLDANAQRGWIFDTAALTYPEFKSTLDAKMAMENEVGVEVG